MNKIKHITAIFIVLGLIATGAYILPKLGLESALSQKEEAPAAAQNDTLAVPWSVTKHISDSFNLPGDLAGLRSRSFELFGSLVRG